MLLRQVRGSAGRRGHQAALFGAICSGLGIPLDRAERMFLFLTARDMTAAGTRLNIVGPLLAVRVNASLHRYLDEVLKANQGGSELRQIDPLIDVLQGAHEKLYSRLFIS